MARREKDRLYYEITREKPFGTFQMLLVGGSAGSVTGFLIASLVGAYEGMEMDALVLVFLVASFLGFFFGALLMWLFLHHFSQLANEITLTTSSPSPQSSMEVSEPEMQTSVEEMPAVDSEEEKGKSIDFVFPELSPDK